MGRPGDWSCERDWYLPALALSAIVLGDPAVVWMYRAAHSLWCVGREARGERMRAVL
jgi:hypothetical protein